MYDLLVPLLKTAPYVGLTDAEALAAVHAATVSRLHMRFGSFRTLAAVLTAEEYAEHGIPMPCSHGGKEQP